MAHDPIYDWLHKQYLGPRRPEVPEYRFYVKGNGQRMKIKRVIQKHVGTVLVENQYGAEVAVNYDQLRK